MICATDLKHIYVIHKYSIFCSVRGYVPYRGGCVFVLRLAMKCPTTFISGYLSSIIAEICGAIALI